MRVNSSNEIDTSELQRLFESGKRKESLEQLLNSCIEYPQAMNLKRLFVRFAGEAGRDVPDSSEFAVELAHCLDQRLGKLSKLSAAAMVVLRKDREFVAAVRMLASGDDRANRAALERGWWRPILTSNLLESLLRVQIIHNRELELVLTQLRRLIVFLLSDKSSGFDLANKIGSSFCSSLALQTTMNEYIYFMDDEENRHLGYLCKEAEHQLARLSRIDTRLEELLLTIACYRPLDELKIDSAWWAEPVIDWPASLYPLVQDIRARYQEREIKESIPVLGKIDNRISVAVRDQYEENPYPRWVGISDFNRTSFGRYIELHHPHFRVPSFLRQPIRLLVAGCGTGLEPIMAHAAWDTRQLLAVDISRSSLAYAIRKSREMGVADEIEFQQADILELEKLPDDNRDFDVVLATGVLHHMEDPLQGWRQLVGLLRPGGIMRIGLYSEQARWLVVKAREIIDTHKIPATADGIRKFRHDILSLKYPEISGLKSYPELYSMSSCRDLLFHVHESRFRLDAVRQHLKDLELEFIGFEGIATAKLKYRPMFPEDVAMNNLENWILFEDQFPASFGSMYQMFAQKM